MQELVRILSAAGFRNVRTYIQSGNVIFDSNSANAAAVKLKLERTLEKAFCYKVAIVLKTLPELEQLVRRKLFKTASTKADVMLFVVFTTDEPKLKPKLPLVLDKEKLTLIGVSDRAAFVVSRRKENGGFGSPNAFVEKALGVSATTRNLNTVNKIVECAKIR